MRPGRSGADPVADENAVKIVCINGMHRSGTSVVARVANLLGVYLGEEEDHIAASRNNPRGFWESQAIKDFDAELLSHLGGSWHRPPIREDGWEQSAELDRFRNKGAALLDEILGDAPVAGWKDPRTSLLVPFWRTVRPIARTVLTVRHPQEVAASLVARNGFDPERSADLWLRYTVAAWRADPQCLLLDYEDFFTDCDATVDRLADGLGLVEPPGKTRDEVRAFFDPSLRHHADRLVAGKTMRLAETLYMQLKSSEPADLLPLADSIHSLWLAQQEAKRQQETAAAAHREAKRQQESAAAAHRRTKRVQSQLDKLRNRRSVRAALSLSRMAAPAYDMARRYGHQVNDTRGDRR